MFQTKVADKTETHFVFSNIFFENHAVYEIMWKKFIDRVGPQMTVWRMRIACWIAKATDAQNQVV